MKIKAYFRNSRQDNVAYKFSSLPDKKTMANRTNNLSDKDHYNWNRSHDMLRTRGVRPHNCYRDMFRRSFH